MIVVTRESSGPDFTAALAAGFADVLHAGDVVALEGDLGAGKTTFTRELAARLGVPAGVVSSPTFVVVNVYPIAPRAAQPTLKRLIHIDAYRVTSDEDTAALSHLAWLTRFSGAARPDLRA